MKKTLIIYLLIIGLFVCTSSVRSEDSLTFSGTDDIIAGTAAKVLEEAYQRIGIPIYYEPLPSYRAIRLANAGIVDGEISRIAGFQKDFPDLIMIPVPVTTLEMLVFTKTDTFSVQGWKSLHPYTIAILRGIKLTEMGTDTMTRTFVSDYDQQLFMLDKGRVDITIFARLEGLDYLCKQNLKKIRMLEPPVIKVDLYHYVHKKHQPLVEQITRTLEIMEQEGRITEIRNQVFVELMECLNSP